MGLGAVLGGIGAIYGAKKSGGGGGGGGYRPAPPDFSASPYGRILEYEMLGGDMEVLRKRWQKLLPDQRHFLSLQAGIGKKGRTKIGFAPPTMEEMDALRLNRTEKEMGVREDWFARMLGPEAPNYIKEQLSQIDEAKMGLKESAEGFMGKSGFMNRFGATGFEPTATDFADFLAKASPALQLQLQGMEQQKLAIALGGTPQFQPVPTADYGAQLYLAGKGGATPPPPSNAFSDYLGQSMFAGGIGQLGKQWDKGGGWEGLKKWWNES